MCKDFAELRNTIDMIIGNAFKYKTFVDGLFYRIFDDNLIKIMSAK